MHAPWLVPLVPLACLLLVVAAWLIRLALSRARDRRLEAHWQAGLLPTQPRPIERVDRLWRCSAIDEHEGKRFELDAQTFADLDLDAVYGAIDRSSTPLGAQCLYEALRRPHLSPAGLTSRRQMVDSLRADATRRRAVQAALAPLSHPCGYSLAPLVWRPVRLALPLSTKLWRAARALLLLLGALAFTVAPAFGLGAITLVAINSLVHLRFEREALDVSAALAYLATTLRAAERLAEVVDDKRGAAIEQHLRATAQLQRRLATLAAQDPLGVVDFVHAVTLTRAIACCRAIDELARCSRDVRALLRHVGAIDMALARAALAEHVALSRPNLDARPDAALRIDGARHPLVEGCVANDYSSRRFGAGLLISGGNATGKSTYLRAVALNVVLAQAIDAVFADRYRAPWLRVMTSISIADDVQAGRSFFLSEAHVALSLLRRAEQRGPRALIVVDELFRGTNSVERVAIVVAVLHHLVARGLVIAATHDNEVLERLGGACFTLACFETGGEPFGLRRGRVAVGNAIATLERLGFPQSVVASARASTATSS
ncbi:MAG: hypothetical protein KC503_25520 [Myxococcales bacterium]|nr:hypothetical protein [Myxococcales bacterium]